MKKRRLQCYFVLIALVLVILEIFWHKTVTIEQSAHFQPEMKKMDLSRLIEKENLSEEDYQLIFQQTGVGVAGVATLDKQGQRQQLLMQQNRFFQQVEVVCEESYVVCRSESLAKGGNNFMPIVETGDIIISLSGHLGGWRTGHAGLVVDAEKGYVLEAVTYGEVSTIRPISHWRTYPTVAVLRLKGVSEEKRQEIGEFAIENLQNLPYDLLSFKCGTKNLTPQKTHCSHLVWAAFANFGYDLDVDQSLVVTPYDLLHSKDLEIVTLYGFDPREFFLQ